MGRLGISRWLLSIHPRRMQHAHEHDIDPLAIDEERPPQHPFRFEAET
jgi:hypothetical protein